VLCCAVLCCSAVGFFGTSDGDASALPQDEALLVGPVEAGHGESRAMKYVARHASSAVLCCIIL
jgi:hypothetical protein